MYDHIHEELKMHSFFNHPNPEGAEMPPTAAVTPEAQTAPSTRRKSAEAQFFKSFEEAFLAQTESADGRKIRLAPDKVWILSATYHQALTTWDRLNGPTIKTLSVKEVHTLIRQCLTEHVKDAKDDNGEMP